MLQFYIAIPFFIQCMGQSWYLATDMQIFIITPFLLYPMWWFQKYYLHYIWPGTKLSFVWFQLKRNPTMIYFSNLGLGFLHHSCSFDPHSWSKYFIDTWVSSVRWNWMNISLFSTFILIIPAPYYPDIPCSTN